jgi:hypothetical protein
MGLKQELAKESSQRGQEVEYLREQLDLKIPKLADQVKIECAEREETDSNILKRFMEEAGDLNNELVGERYCFSIGGIYRFLGKLGKKMSRQYSTCCVM